MKFLELYIGAIILWCFYYYIGKILFQSDKKISTLKLIITISIFSCLLVLLNIINFEIFRGIIKVMISYILFCIFYKIIFKEVFPKIIVGSLILYLSILISETVIAIIISIVFQLNNFDSMLFLKNTIFINLLISTLSYILVFYTQKKLIDFVKNSRFNTTKNILIIIIMLLTLALLGYKIPLSDWNFNIEFILTMIMLLFFCIIGIIVIKQNSEIVKTTSMYQKLAEYSNIMNKVLEEYRVVTHENKNQLLVIRSMLDNKDKNKELKDYVDNLLEKKGNIKYHWVGQLNYIPLSGLKGLINYKLIEMKTIGIEINISISKDISKVKLNQLTTSQKDNLYSIMGIYLDNAIQAAKKSKNKEISLEIYKDKRNITIVLANTYSGKIDLNKIDDYGYTTKGKNHGVGLHIVKRILEEDSIFKQNRKLFGEYFVQELEINLQNKKE